MSKGRKSAVFIAGPTASGKSALALELARAQGGVVINADSMQLYADLEILTARPTPEEMGGVPHRLYGVIDAARRYSVAEWRAAALEEMAAAWTSGRTPILVGGTGLYFRALETGLADIPDMPADIRAEVAQDIEEAGVERAHAMLAEVDPEAAARLEPRDRQRVARALEVWRATGEPLSAWQQRHAAPHELDDCSIDRMVISIDRAELYARCERRFDAMMAKGALGEVERLLARGLSPDLPAMKALGVKPLAAAIRGEIPLAEAVETAKRDTRRYAKRQLTWLRNQFPGWPRVKASNKISKN